MLLQDWLWPYCEICSLTSIGIHLAYFFNFKKCPENDKEPEVIKMMGWKVPTYVIEPEESYVLYKVEKILKDSMDSISPNSVKIQIMGGKVCLKCKGKPMLGDVNILFVFKKLLTMPTNVLPLYLKQTFTPII